VADTYSEANQFTDAEREFLRKFVAEVRFYLRDYPELNRLLDGHQNSDRQILFAALDSLDDWNTSPPVFGTPVGVLQHPSIHLWIRGTIVSLLESNVLLGLRNDLNYSDGGITVDTEKTPMYLQLLNTLKIEYERRKLHLKGQINIQNAYGYGVSSEYRWLHGLDWL